MFLTCSIPTEPEATYKKRRIGQMLVNFGPLSMPPVASQQVARESGISAMVVTSPGPRGCQRARWSVNDMIWASKSWSSPCAAQATRTIIPIGWISGWKPRFVATRFCNRTAAKHGPMLHAMNRFETKNHINIH